MNKSDPHSIVGMEIKAADGTDLGQRVLSYDCGTKNYTVQAIRWSTGEELDYVGAIDVNKITYRYDLDSIRQAE